MPIYEYLVVLYIFKTNWAGIRNERESSRGQLGSSRPQQTWAKTFYIWRPNATEAEERPADGGPLTLLNDLGRDGWKLVASNILDSTVVSGDHYGWTEADVAVRERWTFMREVRT
jgi:hypothetical protein